MVLVITMAGRQNQTSLCKQTFSIFYWKGQVSLEVHSPVKIADLKISLFYCIVNSISYLDESKAIK